jgi:5'-methylthioadenosine phosphorylase
MVVANLHKNAVNAQKAIQETVKRLNANPVESDAHSALKYAVLTRLENVSAETKEKFGVILQKYL